MGIFGFRRTEVRAGQSITLPQGAMALSFAVSGGWRELSNNRAERSIKPFVIGRKIFLFANTPLGA